MSWTKTRAYRCAICEKEWFVEKNEYTDSFLRPFSLPPRWIGSKSRFGKCICYECAEGIRRTGWDEVHGS